MGTISCHSNQSSYPTGIKKHNFLSPLPIDAMCVIWKESVPWLQRRCRLKMLTDDGRTPDAFIFVVAPGVILGVGNGCIWQGSSHPSSIVRFPNSLLP